MKPTILLTLLLTLTASAFEFVGVTDDDTITILYQSNKQYKVRLQHIDCPETGQPFATKAKQALSAKVFNKKVTIKWDEMDCYKRILGEVYIGKRWINPELVSEWRGTTSTTARTSRWPLRRQRLAPQSSVSGRSRSWPLYSTKFPKNRS